MTQTASNPNSKGSASTVSQNGLVEFDQPVVLRQSPNLSRAVIWIILIFTGTFLAWSYFAKIEQVVTGIGKLEPKSTVKEIQVSVNGVVEEVFIEDGEEVQEGQKLLEFDADAALAIANEAGFAITAEDIPSSTDLSDEELEAITGGTVATAIGFFYNLFTLATGITK